MQQKIGSYVRIQQQRQINTYADLWHAAKVLGRKAEASAEGSTWLFMASLTMMAFSLEAYTNFAGPILFSGDWDQRDRESLERLPIRKKIKLIAEKCGFEFDPRAAYWDAVNDVVKFRDTLAHGKQELLTLSRTVPHLDGVDPFVEQPAAIWDIYCRAHEVARIRDGLTVLIKGIHAKLPKAQAGIVFGFGMGHGSATFVNSTSAG